MVSAKSIFIAFFCVILFFLYSCNSKAREAQLETVEFTEPSIDIDSLTADYMTWWNYQYEQYLGGDLFAFNQEGVPVEKGNFLHQLTTGHFIPIKMNTKDDSKPVYKLYSLPETADSSIINTMAFTAETLKFYHEMEGKELPSFNWTDLEGNPIDQTSLKNKIATIKTWFIACVACIEEFPELNQLVNDFTEEEDVLFISLALDEAQDLHSFLKKKPFSYQVVANQGDYINLELGLNTYPTHLLVKDGKIVRVTNKASEMKKELEKLIQ